MKSHFSLPWAKIHLSGKAGVELSTLAQRGACRHWMYHVHTLECMEISRRRPFIFSVSLAVRARDKIGKSARGGRWTLRRRKHGALRHLRHTKSTRVSFCPWEKGAPHTQHFQWALGKSLTPSICTPGSRRRTRPNKTERRLPRQLQKHPRTRKYLKFREMRLIGVCGALPVGLIDCLCVAAAAESRESASLWSAPDWRWFDYSPSREGISWMHTHKGRQRGGGSTSLLLSFPVCRKPKRSFSESKRPLSGARKEANWADSLIICANKI